MGRGRDDGLGLAVGVGLGVAVGVGVGVAVGVGLGEGPDCAQYLLPVLKAEEPLSPPQTIISLLVHTAVCRARGEGALVKLVGVQLSVLGLYLPPVLK